MTMKDNGIINVGILSSASVLGWHGAYKQILNNPTITFVLQCFVQWPQETIPNKILHESFNPTTSQQKILRMRLSNRSVQGPFTKIIFE